MDERIGVLALQGSFYEHGAVIEKLGFQVEFVRYPEQLERVIGLIIPGGESTTIIRLLVKNKLFDRMKNMIYRGFPIFGTCAGMIILSKGVVNTVQKTLEAMDLIVERNSYGRQIESFEEYISIPEIGEENFKAIFIRAPRIKRYGRSVEVLARLKSGEPVLVRQGRLLAASFHPELSGSCTVYRYFVEKIIGIKILDDSKIIA